MPLTFPGHQGLILPLAQKWPRRFDALALSVGAAMPDIIDSALGFSLNGYFKQWYGHTLVGIFTLDLLGGLFLTWLAILVAARFSQSAKLSGSSRAFIRNPKKGAGRWRRFFAKASPTNENAPRHRWDRFKLWSFSVTVGVLSHIGFDLISHDKNYLLYPWRGNIHWLPNWWYTIWFEIQPLPIFGRSYAVGLHTLIWIILSVIGVFLFFRYLSRKSET